MNEQRIKAARQFDPNLLPSLPHVLLKLLEDWEQADPAHWQAAMADDPALAARVVFAWQPALPSTEDSPCTLEHAIAAIGMDGCRSIVRTSAVRHVFGRVDSQRVGEFKKLWWHASLAAHAAAQIADQVGYSNPQEARLAALLAASVELAAWTTPTPDAEAESEQSPEAQGADEAAQAAATQALPDWSLPPFLADASRCRREPVERIAEAHPLVRIVWLANAVADHLTGAGALPAAEARQLFEPLPELQSIAAVARQNAEAAAQRLGVEFEAKVPAASPAMRERREHRRAFADTQVGELPSDRHVRHRLMREVRDLAMMDGLVGLFDAAQDRTSLLSVIGEAASILLGLSRPLFFLPEGADKLRAVPLPGQMKRAAEIVVPAHGGRSLCARAAERKVVLDSFSEEGGMLLDEQVAQLLASSGVYYLPLAAGDVLRGVAAFGVEDRDLPRLRKQRRLIDRLAKLCGRRLRDIPALKMAEGGAEGAVVALRGEIRRVIHEVNNPLSIMKTYVKTLTTRLEADETAARGLRVISEEIDRIAATLRTLVTTPAASAPSERVDINGVITDLLGLARDTLFAPARISIVTRLASGLPAVAIQRDKLKQILLNLMKNAAEAMPEGGTLTIATRDNINRDGQPHIEISIADTGPGIPPDIMSHLFTPVVSTKGEGHSGLGLAIVGGLAKELKISVTCTSDSEGTMFQLLVPRVLPSDKK